MKRHSSYNIINCIKEHIYNNIKMYIIVSIFFLIGIVLGVFLFNNMNNETQEDVNSYINVFLNNSKNEYQINYSTMFRESAINNTIYSVVIWFMGCTVIGIPIVYGLISLRGFSLSYTICSLIINLGTLKGIVFCILSLLLQNIIAIPAILALGVSGNNLYKSIVKDKRKENIKVEIIRHTLFSLLMLLMLIIASFIEAYISSNLTLIYIKNI